MPVITHKNFPANEILLKENITVLSKSTLQNDTAPFLRITIVNLMPLKTEAEVQLLRILSISPLLIDVEFVRTKSYNSKNTSQQHLLDFYTTIDKIENQHYDGLIITGAPVEHIAFEDVIYWDELKYIMNWATNHVTSTFFICWAAQAGLYHHYGINKYPLESKLFGVFPHSVNNIHHPLIKNFDDLFFAPHSRYTEVLKDDIEKIEELEILSESTDAGVYLVVSKNGKQVFVTGHSEYDEQTLKREYFRDVQKGLDISIPKNYFPENNPNNKPVMKWRNHSLLLFRNWINLLNNSSL